MIDWIAKTWCMTMHRRAMWPIHGRYVCPQCLRETRLNWGDAEPSTQPVAKTAQDSSLTAVSTVTLLR